MHLSPGNNMSCWIRHRTRKIFCRYEQNIEKGSHRFSRKKEKMRISTLVSMWRPEVFFQVVSFLLISFLLHHGGREGSIVVPFFYSASLMLLPLSLQSFLLLFSLFSCCALSLPTLRFHLSLSPSFFPICHQCQGYWTSPSYQAIMSMFTKALIHQNKGAAGRAREKDGWQGEEREQEWERETLECTLEWLWTVNPCSFLLLWLYFFPNSLLGYFWVLF